MSEARNSVARNLLPGTKKATKLAASLRGYWRTGRDSNPRPPA